MRRIVIALTLIALSLSAAFVLGQSGGTTIYDPGLKMTVIHSSCSLILAPAVSLTPEVTASSAFSTTSNLTPTADFSANVDLSATVDLNATEEVSAPDYPALIPGTDCYLVSPLLTVHSNDTLWIAIELPHEPHWQLFSPVENDPYPPRFDRRGRYIGCSIPEMGAQVCRVLWANLGTTYEIEIPVIVTSAYTGPIIRATQAPAPVPTQPISTPVIPPTAENSGIWGICGSCGTCGGPWEQCVQAPDNTCVWDAARCEHPSGG